LGSPLWLVPSHALLKRKPKTSRTVDPCTRSWAASPRASPFPDLLLSVAPAARRCRSEPRSDCRYWRRGPEVNSHFRETGLPDIIDPRGGPNSNLPLESRERGPRHPRIVSAGAKFKFCFAPLQSPAPSLEQEKVIADAATARTVWEKNKFNVCLQWRFRYPSRLVQALLGMPPTAKNPPWGGKINGLFSMPRWKKNRARPVGHAAQRNGTVSSKQTYGGGRTQRSPSWLNTPGPSRARSPRSAGVEPAFPPPIVDYIFGFSTKWTWRKSLANDNDNPAFSCPEDTITVDPTVAVFMGKSDSDRPSRRWLVYAFQPQTGK